MAKSVFQVHGIDAEGAVIVQRKLPRSRLLAFFEKLPRCLVGIEACATPTSGRASSGRWATRSG
jgi:transposase